MIHPRLQNFLERSVIFVLSNTFAACKSLTYITIQPCVTTIDFGAFYCCDNLDDATKLEIRKRFGDDVFKKTMCSRTCISKKKLLGHEVIIL